VDGMSKCAFLLFIDLSGMSVFADIRRCRLRGGSSRPEISEFGESNASEWHSD
jgi:hypothetical protein